MNICPECFGPTKEPGACERCRCCEASRFLVLIVVLALGLIALCQSCKGSVVTEPFLDSIAQRESGNNPRAIGRAGELGAFQLKRCAVAQVNADRGWRMPFRRAAVDHGRAYARAYCLYIERVLSVRMRRQPSQSEIYRAYRFGPFTPGPSAAFSRATISPLGANRIARGDGPGRSSWSRMDRARIQQGSRNFAPARGAMGLTERHQVPGSIPEQAISCEGREGNGKLVATSPLRHMRERQPDSEEQVGAKGVTAGETASISPTSK